MVKICQECGKEFEAKRKTSLYCYDLHFNTCQVCGKSFSYSCSPKDKPNTCSKECKYKFMQMNLAEKYGVSNVSQLAEVKEKKELKQAEALEKSRQTCLARYGVESVSQVKEIVDKQVASRATEECKEKTKATYQERYRVDHIFQSKSFREEHCDAVDHNRDKAMKTIAEKYGIDNVSSPTQVAEIADKAKLTYQKTVEEKYDGVRPCQTDEVRLRISEGVKREESKRIRNNQSKYHDEDYHVGETELAVNNGHRRIHVFDWDDEDKIINMLSPKETLYARKCTLSKIDDSTCNEFLNRYHLQGSCRGQVIRYGLYYQDKLIEVMTFGKPRYNKKYQWELLRLCTDYRYKVVGGASKLFSAFIKEESPESVISYCDRSKFDGSVYTNIGMKLDHVSSPAKVWSKGNKIITDNLLRQRGFDQLFGTSYGKGTSNEELMLINGWLPVYDCGQLVFSYENVL